MFRLQPPALDPARAELKASVLAPVLDLGAAFRPDLRRSRHVRVLLHASVTKIHANESRSAVSGLTIRTLEGKTSRVRAHLIVLCGGGIENARLLLSDGLGNARDLVGRYFQDHPNGRGAGLMTDTPRRLQDLFGLLYKRRLRYFPKISLSRRQQQTHQTLSCASDLHFDIGEDTGVGAAKRLYRAPRSRELPADALYDCRLMARDLGSLADMTYRRYGRGLSPSPRPQRVWLRTYSEQAPNPDSRVSLSDRRDALGLPMARVDWRLSDLDRHTMDVMARTIAWEFERLNLARAVLAPWLDGCNPDWTDNVNDNHYHMETTRTAADPAQRVATPQ